jgi:hypothetical protein
LSPSVLPRVNLSYVPYLPHAPPFSFLMVWLPE